MTASMKRRDVVNALLEKRGGLLVVAGLGSTAWDITAAGDGPLNFPLWGAMGNAAMIGLGLALAQPERRVLVITGDGEMLMGLGSLATIGVQQPANLAVVVIDNERYGETGMQATHTAAGVDLAKVAAACGFGSAKQVREPAELGALRAAIHGAPGPHFAQVKVVAEKLPLVLPPRDGGILKSRFRKALLGNGADLD
ncbi:MAG TPA: thiamine pyrophosphate-dependent enzyme [Burkholderiales bacterium]|jgi:thiamine pyrophosphate-dependent acetolactate synthase large subunit-like protein